MKSYKKELHFNIPSRRGLVNITDDVQEAINESGIKEGLCLINPILHFKRMIGERVSLRKCYLSYIFLHKHTS